MLSRVSVTLLFTLCHLQELEKRFDVELEVLEKRQKKETEKLEVLQINQFRIKSKQLKTDQVHVTCEGRRGEGRGVERGREGWGRGRATLANFKAGQMVDCW